MSGPARIGDRETALWIALVALGLSLRLAALGDRPFHHDESQVAYFSWIYWRDHDYEYDPALHGPWMYMLTAATYAIAGASDFAARLPPALMGAALVGLPFFARRQLGRTAAVAAALMLAVSPSVLYYSRFAREDIHIATLTLAVVVIVFRFLDRPRPWHPIAVLALLAGTLTVKESGLFFGALSLLYIVVVLLHKRARKPVLQAARAVPRWSWVAAALAFASLYGLLFSSLGSHPAGIWDGIWRGPSYWSGQHPLHRGGEPWFFYPVLLAAVEGPILVLGVVGAVVTLRAPTPMTAFLVVWFAGSLAFYTWAGEKFAWLALHTLVPLVLLAGIGVQAIWNRRPDALRSAGLALVCIGGIYLSVSSFLANADGPTNPREPLVAVQSAADVKETSDRVIALDAALRRAAGRVASVVVDPTDGGGFPWAWYLRDLRVSYDADVGARGYVPTADILILSTTMRRRLERKLGAYHGRRITHRVFRRGFHAFTPTRLWGWFARRRPLSPVGTVETWVYIRATS